MSRNVRNATVAFAQQVLGAVSGALGIFFVARYMPDADFQVGIVGFGLSFVGLFLALQRAFDGAHVKRISEGQDLGQCVTTYFLLKAASTAAFVVLVLGAVAVWTEGLGQGFQTPLHVRLIQLFVVYQVLNGVGELTRRTLEGRGNILIGQMILSSEHVVKTLVMVYVAFRGLEPFEADARNAFGIGIAYVIGASVLAVVALVFLVGQPFGRPSRKLARRYLSFALPATITASIFLVSTNASMVILQLFWGARDGGFFFAPSRYVQFLPAVATAVGTALFPVFSSLHAEGQTAPDIVRRTLRAVSLLILPAIAVTVALPTAVVHVLLSDKFLPASAPVLALLALGAYVNAVRMTLSSKLAGVDRPQDVTKAAVASMAANVVLTIVFVAPSLGGVPLFGLRATGAALAVALSSMVGMTATLRAARRHAGVELPALWKHGLMFLGTVGMLSILPLLVTQNEFRIYHLALACALSVAAFSGLGLLLGEVGRRDLQTVKLVLNPGEWVGFLRREAGPPRR